MSGALDHDPLADDPLLKRIAQLRWRRRLFLYGPPAGFAFIALMVVLLKAVGQTPDDGNDRPPGVEWLAYAAIVVTSIACALCFWWAPAARCPQCRQPMGGKWFSPLNLLWVWDARPTCWHCKFDPFGYRDSARR